MLTVTIREKDGGERRLVFDSEEVTIGRAKGSDILLPKNNISKRHARLVDKDDKVVLVDLRSTNGTYVNGHRITAPEIIGPGDKIYIGDFVLRVSTGAAEQAAHEEATAAFDQSVAEQAARVSSGPTIAVGAAVAAAHLEDAAEEAKTRAQAGRAAPMPPPEPEPEPQDSWDDVLESTRALDLGAVPDEAPPEPELLEDEEPLVALDLGDADLVEEIQVEPEPEPDVDEAAASVDDWVAAAAEELEANLGGEPQEIGLEGFDDEAEAAFGEPEAAWPSEAASATAWDEEPAAAVVEEPEEVTFALEPEPEPEPELEPAPAKAARDEIRFRPTEPALDEQARRAVTGEGAQAVAALRAMPETTGAPLGAHGLGQLAADPDVLQVLVNRWDRVLVRRAKGGAQLRSFESQARLDAAVLSVLRQLGLEEDAPAVVDGSLEGGVSVHVVQAPLAPHGPLVALRRARSTAVTAQELVRRGALSDGALQYLRDAVARRRNIMIAGLPGSGRTTLAGALAGLVPPEERVVVVEDAREISLPHHDVVHLDKGALEHAGEHFADLVPRLLAQRVVVDPVATADIYGFVSLALAGYDGLIATTSSDGCHGLLRRMALELELTIGARLDDRARAMVSEAVDVVVLVRRTAEGLRVEEIVELQGEGADGYRTLAILNRG